MFIGLALVTIGVVALLVRLGVLPGGTWGYVWPILLVALGISFLWPRRGRHWYSGPWRRCWGWGEEEEGRQR